MQGGCSQRIVGTPPDPLGRQAITVKHLNNTCSNWYTVLYTHCMCPVHSFFLSFFPFFLAVPFLYFIISILRLSFLTLWCYHSHPKKRTWVYKINLIGFHNRPRLLIPFSILVLSDTNLFNIFSHSLWNTKEYQFSFPATSLITNWKMIFPKSPRRHFDPFSLNNIPLSLLVFSTTK